MQPTNPSTCIGSDKPLALHTGTDQALTEQFSHSGRCYNKNPRGTAFASSNPQNKISLCIIGGKSRTQTHDDRRPFATRSFIFFFFLVSYLGKSMCSLLLFFLFLFRFHRSLRSSLFNTCIFLDGKGLGGNTSLEGKLDLRLWTFAFLGNLSGCALGKACLLVPVEFG